MDCTRPEYWDVRYRAHRIPWDLHGVPPALAGYLRRTAKPGAALLPGCGSAYEIKAFCDLGWTALAIDFSPAAVERARSFLGPLAATVRLADFFTDELGGPFDLIYERTFLCSLPPARWPDYSRRMAQLLKPGGLLAGIFAYGEEPEPPPFPITAPAARELFGGAFRLIEDEPIPDEDSLPLFAGMERWQVWLRA